MIYALYGFLFGLVIPYMARRFSKFMPATFAYALYYMIKPFRKYKFKSAKVSYRKLKKKYAMRSVGWAVFTSAVSFLAYLNFGDYNIGWILLFIWSLLLLTEIDYRMYLLPDLITVPLILTGFVFAVFSGAWVMPAESAIGAFLGYFIPVLANLLVVWKYKDAFGGGDIKLLSAVGAWMGLTNLLYVIITSCVIFMLYALVNKKRSGAFGPAIAMASILVAFYAF